MPKLGRRAWMFLPPANQDSAARPTAALSGANGSWLAAPFAEVSVPYSPPVSRLVQARALASPASRGEPPNVRLAEASVRVGGCFVRPLPLDATCASAARRM